MTRPDREDPHTSGPEATPGQTGTTHGRAVEAEIGRDPAPRTITVGAGAGDPPDGAGASVDILDADRLGVRLKGVRVRRAGPLDVAEAARDLPERLRQLGEDIVPVEVDPGLGGTVLRSAPDEVQDGEFYEVEAQSSGTIGIRRLRTLPEGGREETDWTMPRRKLGRLIDDLLG